MKTIIAGGREVTYSTFVTCLRHILPYLHDDITEIVSGEARGVDTYGADWGRANRIHIETFPADWVKYGKRVGFIRNEEMAVYADTLIAIWDGVSTGTADMIGRAKVHNLDVYVAIFNEKDKQIKIEVIRKMESVCI